MKLSKLLATRQRLLRQTQLANLAYAYPTLRRFAVRIGNANLSGLVKLRPADPEDESYWATLTALGRVEPESLPTDTREGLVALYRSYQSGL